MSKFTAQLVIRVSWRVLQVVACREGRVLQVVAAGKQQALLILTTQVSRIHENMHIDRN